MEITVEEYTSPISVTVEPHATIESALLLMKEHLVRHLPVVLGDKVVGIVSERDLLTHHNKAWRAELRVKDIMSTSILTAYINDSLGQVAFRLSSEKKGSALVLDSEGRVYGIFTTTDALNALVELQYPEVHRKTTV